MRMPPLNLSRELREHLCREYLDRYLAEYGFLPTIKEAYVALGGDLSMIAAEIKECEDRGAKPSPYAGDPDWMPARVPAPSRDEVLARLAEHRETIVQKFGVKSLAIFGSVARDDARPDSDLDVLVEFEEMATADGYFGLKFFLEGLFDRKVDLVTRKSLKPILQAYVEKDSIYVA